jgi:hypothetical protein
VSNSATALLRVAVACEEKSSKHNKKEVLSTVTTGEARQPNFIFGGRTGGIGKRPASTFPRFSVNKEENMLSETVDWQHLKASVTYVESDSLAVVRNGRNSLQWLPVLLNAATEEPFVLQYGELVPVESLGVWNPRGSNSTGFVRYEKVKPLTRKFLDTATLETLEFPK